MHPKKRTIPSTGIDEGRVTGLTRKPSAAKRMAEDGQEKRGFGVKGRRPISDHRRIGDPKEKRRGNARQGKIKRNSHTLRVPRRARHRVC